MREELQVAASKKKTAELKSLQYRLEVDLVDLVDLA